MKKHKFQANHTIEGMGSQLFGVMCVDQDDRTNIRIVLYRANDEKHLRKQWKESLTEFELADFDPLVWGDLYIPQHLGSIE